MDKFLALRDWLEELPPWQRGELKQFESAVSLSSKLWGSPENLKRQLEASVPEVPAGLDRKGLLTLKTKAIQVRSHSRRSPASPGTPVQPWNARAGSRYVRLTQT